MVTFFSLEMTYEQGLILGRQGDIVISAAMGREKGLGGDILCFVTTIKDFDSLKCESRT